MESDDAQPQLAACPGKFFTPPLSDLALTGFPGETEPCPVWGEQTLVPAIRTAEDPQGHIRTAAAKQH